MILLATDLDRTLLPNGPLPDDGGIPALFAALKDVPYKLAYVTGRNLDLVREAQKEYGVPTPDYLIAEVGTVLYRKDAGALVPDARWEASITSSEPNWVRDRITSVIGSPNGLALQEDWKQNPFKISYYLHDHAEKDAVLARIDEALAQVAVRASVLWSVDPLAGNVGLIDVLPEVATKATALEFLRAQENLTKEKVVYCGDSGNDILPLTRCYTSILVKNAPEDVKEKVRQLVEETGCADRLYIAVGAERSGNYASGILEGLVRFGIVSA